MKIITDIAAMKAVRKATRARQSIGFVATMGNLHAGHASLLQHARNENDLVVLSIFINPTQFNRSDDFDHYPRTLEADIALAKSLKVDYVFTPEKQTLYPDDYCYQLTENDLSKHMEGAHRPGHFDGMLTVVMKLLQIIAPERAYFGKKDYQQYQLIEGMARAFFLDCEIIACETMRETSGLALSSRNARLSTAEKKLAEKFNELLRSQRPCQQIITELTQLGFSVDYIEQHGQRRFGAVSLGDIRLIDNVEKSTPGVAK